MMSAKRDYYEILGVSQQADGGELKKAFRSLARKYHPDKSDAEDAEERFKEIQEAYAILSDSEKRQVYDRYGHQGLSGGGGGGFQGFHMNFEDIFSGDLNDIFSSFFGGGQRRRNSRGSDVLVRHNIPFSAIVEGTSEELELNLLDDCQTCDGTGASDPTKNKHCTVCGGRGSVTVRQQVGPFMVNQSTQHCPECSGRGSIIDKPCRNCRGEGRETRKQKIRFDIPTGAESGTRLRMRGHGEPAPRGGGDSGDLIIQLEVQAHPWFERDGADLIMSLPVGFPELALGARISLAHIDGKELLIDIPKGSSAGQTIEIRGRGLAHRRGQRGSVVVLLKLHMPKKFDKKTKKALEELGHTLSIGAEDVEQSVRDEAEYRRGNG
jgi:molecular chaperone DnaJ